MAAESLRLLRRGLSRSEGFSLYFAVCNSPADRDSFIASLAESLPERSFSRVAIKSDSTDPLEEVIRQAPTRPDGPVMLVDLEKAVPSSTEDHPLLQIINLRREEWPEKIPCPVVLWIPQYLLGLIGRKAPDFLDWRSDTVHLPSLHGMAASTLLGETWKGGTDARMPKEHRLARIRELESRLKARHKSKDTVTLTAHSRWLSELGNHFELLGELDHAEAMLRKALAIQERLGLVRGTAANYGNLGLIYRARGDLDQAETMLRKALAVYEKLGGLHNVADGYANLAAVFQLRGDLNQAETMLRESLAIHEKLDPSVGMAANYGNLGLMYRERGDLDQAEAMLRKALAINEKLGSLDGMGRQYNNLGLVQEDRGDLDQAEAMFRKALTINEKLGRLEGIAKQYSNIGTVFRSRGDLDHAEAMFDKALEISEKLGLPEGLAITYANLGNVFKQRKDAAKAREYWNRALGLYEKIGMSHMVTKVQCWLDRLEDHAD